MGTNYKGASLNFLEENHWGRPFFALFKSVRDKLQFTVSLNHTVDAPDCSSHPKLILTPCHMGIFSLKILTIFDQAELKFSNLSLN